MSATCASRRDRLDARPSLATRAGLRARLSLSPTRLIGLLLTRGRTGITLRELRTRPSGVDLGPLSPRLLPRRLQTPDRRIALAPAVVLDDLDRLNAVEARGQNTSGDTGQNTSGDIGWDTGWDIGWDTGGGELLLIGRRHQRDGNSWLHNSERLTRGKPRRQLLVHPADLARRSIEHGAVVTVTSRVGTVRVELVASDDMMLGVVSLPPGYGHARNPGMATAAAIPGVSINDLTDPDRLDISGNAALSGVPVTVTRR